MITLVEKSIRLYLAGPPEELFDISDALKFDHPQKHRIDLYHLWRRTEGKKGWDGKVKPLKIDRSGHEAEIMRGHKDMLLSTMDKLGIEVNPKSKLLESPFVDLTLNDLDPKCIAGDFPLDYNQLHCILQWLKFGTGIGKIAVNGGKCLARGTKVLMFDATEKAVENIRVGDTLMGPDSKPRTVTGLGSGVDEMFRVHQSNGDDYCCNSDHILSLKTSGFRSSDGKSYSTGEIRNLSIKDYLCLSDYHKKSLKGYKVGIEFPRKPILLPPYFLGLWLGDGSSDDSAVTTGDTSIKDYLYTMAEERGLKVRCEEGQGCETLHLAKHNSTGSHRANSVKYALRALGLIGNKHIPRDYLVNSRAIRESVLAGLLDSDGYGARDRSHYEITLKIKRLSDDVLWLCRSLGFRSTQKPKPVNGTMYWRVSFKADLSHIPLLLPRKMAPVPKRNPNYAISVEPTGRGEYFGFTLDGDGLFLLADFTVTHNTAAFGGFAATLKKYMEDARFVYITDRERLQTQVGGEMPKFLPGWDITKFGGGSQDFEGKDMVVCTLAMLRKHKDDLAALGWFNTFNAVMFDESHHASAESVEELMMMFGGAFFRIGASDTIREDDPIAQMRITGLLGPVRMEVQQAELIESGRSALPHIYIIDDLSWRGKYQHVPYQAEIDSIAWALLGGQSEVVKGIYKGPVIELNDKGEQVTVTKRVLEGTSFIKVQEPKTVPGLHLIEIKGVDYEVDSSYCLLERSVDRCIVRFKERNELITEWSTFFAKQGKRTLVVATRLMHIMILESLICSAYDASLVRTLSGEDSIGTKNKTFEWFKNTKGAILITSLVKEGISINEIEAGVVADYIGDGEFANQIVGRFLRRKKEGENEAEIVWFMDRQQGRFERGCKSVIQDLSAGDKGFVFYHPLIHPADLTENPPRYRVWDSAHEAEIQKDSGQKPTPIPL